MARKIYVNFNSVGDSGSTWTANATGTAATGVLFSDLIDSNGNLSGVSLHCDTAFAGTYSVGSQPSTGTDEFPLYIVDDGLYTPSGVTSQLRLSGLPVGAAYNLKFTAGATTAARHTQFTVGGESQDYIYGGGGNPSTPPVFFEGVVGESGELSIDVEKAASGQYYGYINAFVLSLDASKIAGHKDFNDLPDENYGFGAQEDTFYRDYVAEKTALATGFTMRIDEWYSCDGLKFILADTDGNHLAVSNEVLSTAGDNQDIFAEFPSPVQIYSGQTYRLGFVIKNSNAGYVRTYGNSATSWKWKRLDNTTDGSSYTSPLLLTGGTDGAQGDAAIALVGQPNGVRPETHEIDETNSITNGIVLASYFEGANTLPVLGTEASGNSNATGAGSDGWTQSGTNALQFERPLGLNPDTGTVLVGWIGDSTKTPSSFAKFVILNDSELQLYRGGHDTSLRSSIYSVETIHNGFANNRDDTLKNISTRWNNATDERVVGIDGNYVPLTASDWVSTGYTEPNIYFGNRSTGDRATYGKYKYVFVWDRKLSDAEITSIEANPYQLVKPKPTANFIEHNRGAGTVVPALSNVQNGDLILVTICDDAPPSSFGAPTGFQLIGQGSHSGDGISGAMYGKIAASESGDYTFTGANVGSYAVAVFRSTTGVMQMPSTVTPLESSLALSTHTTNTVDAVSGNVIYSAFVHDTARVPVSYDSDLTLIGDSVLNSTNIPHYYKRVEQDVTGYSASVTYSTTDGGILFAVVLAADTGGTGSTTVENSLATLWGIYQHSSNALELRFNLLQAVANSTAINWSLLQQVITSTDLNWSIFNSVDGQLKVDWSVFGKIAAQLGIEYNILQAVDKSVGLDWALLQKAESAAQLRFNLLQQAANSIGIEYNILAPVNRSFSILWDNDGSLNVVNSALRLDWSLLNEVNAALSTEWSLLSSVGVSLELRHQIAQQVAQAIEAQYNIQNSVASSVELNWHSIEQVDGALSLRWSIQADEIVVPIHTMIIAEEGRVMTVLGEDRVMVIH